MMHPPIHILLFLPSLQTVIWNSPEEAAIRLARRKGWELVLNMEALSGAAKNQVAWAQETANALLAKTGELRAKLAAEGDPEELFAELSKARETRLGEIRNESAQKVREAEGRARARQEKMRNGGVSQVSGACALGPVSVECILGLLTSLDYSAGGVAEVDLDLVSSGYISAFYRSPVFPE
jgi:hypothetical protein